MPSLMNSPTELVYGISVVHGKDCSFLTLCKCIFLKAGVGKEVRDWDSISCPTKYRLADSPPRENLFQMRTSRIPNKGPLGIVVHALAKSVVGAHLSLSSHPHSVSS